MVVVSASRLHQALRDEQYMAILLYRRYAHHRGFVAGITILLLAFAFLCPAMLPAVCAGNQQTCQSQACWLLESAVAVPVLIVFAWIVWVRRFPLPREYRLLLFKPPRPCLP